MRWFQPNIKRLEEDKNVDRLKKIIQKDPSSKLGLEAAQALHRIEDNEEYFKRFDLRHKQRDLARSTTPKNEELSVDFDVYGDLTLHDLAAIQKVIHGFRERKAQITDIVVLDSNCVFVTTGGQVPPIRGENGKLWQVLAGGGQKIVLVRDGETWTLETMMHYTI